MIPSELDEIWCVDSPGNQMYPKEISSKLLVWILRNGLLNILLFVIFSLRVIIQSIITWAFFNVLRNGFHHVWVVLECTFNVRQSNGFQSLCDLDWFSQIQSHIDH